MEYKQRCFQIVSEEGEIKTTSFDCIPLGRVAGEKIGVEAYDKGAQIHLTDKEAYIIYVYFRDQDGNIKSFDYAKLKA